MQVNEFLEIKNSVGGSVELTGYLVLVDNNLVLIDSSEINHFKNAKRVDVDKQELKYVLRDMLLPLGGESSIFHRARLFGVIESVDIPVIRIQKLQVQERGNADWLDVDLSPKHIVHCKVKYMPDEGFDFFKEMGD